MHFTAELAAEVGVSELMESFDDDHAGVEKQQIVWGEDTLALILDSREGIGDDLEAEPDDDQPDQSANGADQLTEERQSALEESVGVEQREPHEHEIHELSADFALAAFAVTFEQLGAILREVVLQEVCEIELGEQLDDRFLTGSVVGSAIDRFLPGLLDGFAGAHARYKVVGCRAQAKELIAERIFEDIPAFSAEVLATNVDPGAQADLLAGDAVPGFAKRG